MALGFTSIEYTYSVHAPNSQPPPPEGDPSLKRRGYLKAKQPQAAPNYPLLFKEG